MISMLALALTLLLALLVPPVLPAPPVAAQPEPPVVFGSAVHPEAVFAKRSVTTLDLARPGPRIPEDAERAAIAAHVAGLGADILDTDYPDVIRAATRPR